MTKIYPQYRDPSTGITYHSPGPGRIPCNDDDATPYQVPLTPRSDRRRAGREPGSASNDYNGPDKLSHKCTGDGKHTSQCRNVSCPNHAFKQHTPSAADPNKDAVEKAERDLRRADGQAISAEALELPGGYRAKVLQEKGAVTPGVASFAASIQLPR